MPKKIDPPFVLGTNFGRLRIGSYREDGSKYLMDDDDYYIYYNIDFYKEKQ